MWDYEIPREFYFILARSRWLEDPFQRKKLQAKPISDRSNFQKRPQCERGLITTVEPEKMKSLFDPRWSLR